ncbi:MAG TPA: ABC transporter permease [Bryobacteraceae bacterium]|nr:ABC transporter permease [Bryobacteraceae bacterium]
MAIFSELRYTLRNLYRAPMFTAVAVGSLALGIGANTAIFTLINAVLLRSLPGEHPEELVEVRQDYQHENISNPVWETLRDTQDVFTSAFAWDYAIFNLARGGEARYVRGAWVSGGYFSTLGLRAAAGRMLTALDDRRGCSGAAVISHQFAEDHPDAFEHGVSIDGHTLPVLGVAEAGFRGLEVGRAEDVFLPLCAQSVVRGTDNDLDRHDLWDLLVIARSKPGLGREQVNARLKAMAHGIFAKEPPAFAARSLEAIPQSEGRSYLRQGYGSALKVLLGVVGLLLLIACANVANLLLARGAARRKDIAVRMALGARRWHVMRQSLIESALYAAAGGALGIAFAQWGSRVLVSFLGGYQTPAFLDLSLDARVLAFTIAVSAAASLLFGLAPAWRGMRVDPQTAIKSDARGIAQGQSRFGAAKTLVAIQAAVSLVLVTGAGLLVSTFWTLDTMDVGFDRDHALIIQADARHADLTRERLLAEYDTVRQRLAALSGVRAASFSLIWPISGDVFNATVSTPGFQPRSRRDETIWYNYASPGYLEAIGTPLIAGRDFDSRDGTQSANVAIINQTAARQFFHAENPIGRICQLSGRTGAIEIVGVMKDARYVSLTEPQHPAILMPQSQDPHSRPFITFEVRTTGSPLAIAAAARDTIAGVDSTMSIEMRPLSSHVDDSLRRQRMLAEISGFFGAVALLLAMLGLYGVVAHNMARRRGEIGLRMALGAARSRVVRMVLGDAAASVGSGLAAGALASLALTRFVASFLYGVQARDPWMLGAAAALFSAAAMLAAYLPARRAARTDPMAALRDE